MKSYILLLFSLCITTFLSAQSSETRSVGSFDGIAVSASVDAELVKGSKNEVKITVENYDLHDVKTEIENGVLKVGMKSKNGWNWNKGGKKRKVKAVITFSDELDYIAVGSSADLISHDVITGDELELKVSSSGDMSVEIDVNHLDASVSSSGDLSVEGKAHSADVDVSSSGDFYGKKFQVKEADLKASSSADISIRVSDKLKARASSSADIEYYGNPEIRDIHKSSGADVTQH